MENRYNVGKKLSLLGFCINIVLAIFKIVLGAIFHIISLLGDGINNLSDSVSSFLTYLGFKISQKPGDSKHPFGHARAEYIISNIISIIIFYAGIQLLIESIKKIRLNNPIIFNRISIIVLIISIILKASLSFFFFIKSRQIEANLLKLTAKDYIIDCLSSFAVLIGIVFSRHTKIAVDGYLGILVSFFIFKVAIEIFFPSINSLLGEKQLKEENKIIDIVKKDKNILGFHDLIVHDYGPRNTFASLHVEIDSNLTFIQSHQIIDNIERKILKNTGINIILHADPITLDNKLQNKMKDRIEKALKNINNRIKIYDFRLNKNEDIYHIYFDINIPEKFKIKDREIREIIENELKDINHKLYIYKDIKHAHILI